MSPTPILYDRDCGLCRVTLALVLGLDRRRRLQPVALQDPEAVRLLPRMPEAQRMNSWHLVTDGDVHSAGAGFGPLLDALGAQRLAGLVGRFPRASERAYRLVADNRTAIGKRIPAAVKRRADRTIARRGAPTR